MGFLETIVLGSYAFTAWVYRRLMRLEKNHLVHMEDRLQVIEKRLHIP